MPEDTDTPPSQARHEGESLIASSPTIDRAVGAVLGVVGVLQAEQAECHGA